MEGINTQKFIFEVAQLIDNRPGSPCAAYRLIVEDGQMKVVPVIHKVKKDQIFFTFTPMELGRGLTTARWAQLEAQANQVMEAIEKCETS